MSSFLSFDWIEGNRTFDVLFGVTTSAMCLTLAVPLLYWVLPRSRRWFFGRDADPHQYVQLAYGVLAMSMAFADALCRFIPHRPLAFTHPSFFLTTMALVALLGPGVVAALRTGSTGWIRRRSLSPLIFAIPVFVAFPVSAVVTAFW